MADLTPNNREEFWLQGMVDGQTDLTPNKRREYWYKEIVDAIGSGGGGGTGGGVLKVSVNFQTRALDKTWQEIADAPFSVLYVPENDEYNIYYLWKIGNTEDGYFVTFVRIIDGNPNFSFLWLDATSPTDYPVVSA